MKSCVSSMKGGLRMEKVKEMLNQVVNECEKEGIPFLAACGLDKIFICEYAPDNTPIRLVKARTTLLNTTAQVKRQIEIEA
jgi:hypothetical protein